MCVLPEAAAFGRLCVETLKDVGWTPEQIAAAFGRLCVETAQSMHCSALMPQPPSGGCVLKRYCAFGLWFSFGSRLRAAVC